MHDDPRLPSLLTIAGTDPSNAAGIGADLQTFRDLGFHGASVITAVLWQNTTGVGGVQPLAPELIERQLDAVWEDLRVEAIKIGLVPTAEAARALGRWLESLGRDRPAVVLDPVLASGVDGRGLVAADLVEALVGELVGRADVLTPNLPEAAALLGHRAEGGAADRDLEALARELGETLAPGAVLLKVGHRDAAQGPLRDLLWRRGDDETPRWLAPLPRVADEVRGTGCQLASAVAAGLAAGADVEEACERARGYLNRLLRRQRGVVGRGRKVVVRGGWMA